MKRKDIIGEISLGDYRKKAGMQKAQAGMGAMFGRSPEERAKALATFNKREKGLNRVKDRDEKARKAEIKRQQDADIAALPELKAEYEQMKAKYKSLGGSNWQYADREQNLTDREREARSMEGPMNNLWRRINAAEKAQGMNEEIGYDEITPKSASYILQKLDQGVSMTDILDDFPELSRMMDVIAHDHGLHPDDDFEEIENVLMNDLEDIASEGDDFGDYGDEEEVEESGMLKVAKDDEKQTVLLNPATGVQTQIDKTNPNAPRLAQDDKGKLTLQMPQGAQTGGMGDKPAPLVGKEVQVDQLPQMEDIRRLAGL